MDTVTAELVNAEIARIERGVARDAQDQERRLARVEKRPDRPIVRAMKKLVAVVWPLRSKRGSKPVKTFYVPRVGWLEWDRRKGEYVLQCPQRKSVSAK